MARNNKGFLDLLVELPWWVSVIVSMMVYIGLKFIVPSLSLESPLFQGIQKALPSLAYIFSGILLIPAPISAFNAWGKCKLVDNRKNINKKRINMARKNEGLLDLLVELPWWVSVIVSMIVYIGLKFIIPSLSLENPLFQSIQKALPSLAHIFAGILLIPAPFSAFNAWRKRKLLDNQENIQTIRDLSWREFEELIAEAYRRQNYTVIENTTAGADGGIDIRLKKDGVLHLVQCKNWKTSKVGVKVVREMYGVMVAEDASSVKIIISGMFTQEAKNFANDKPIDLVDGSQLEKLIVSVQNSPSINRITPIMSQVKEVINTASCPRCGGLLKLRTARRGKNSGGQFWGCSAYPKCRYTKDA